MSSLAGSALRGGVSGRAGTQCLPAQGCDYTPMTEANNENQAKASLPRVGLVAEAAEAVTYADALRACRRLDLCSQAGMPQAAALPKVQWFDDTRVLIAQGEIDAVVIATSPRAGVNLGDVAAAHGVHVWRSPPLARNFAEALEVTRRLQTIDVVYRVASWWEHVGADIRWALRAAPGFEAIFSELDLSAAGPPLQSWRSSQVDAVGGVLACDGYASLEALSAIRGLPESVVGAVGKCRRRPSEAPRETEDVAEAILRYEAGGMARVRATWDLPPFEQTTLHHGSEASVRYSESSVAVLDADGSVRDERPLPGDFLAAEMTRFAAQISNYDAAAPREVDVDRHLMVSAILEATYLSARTEHPESPGRLFEAQKWPAPRR
jgi:predicted dehydrogenase